MDTAFVLPILVPSIPPKVGVTAFAVASLHPAGSLWLAVSLRSAAVPGKGLKASLQPADSLLWRFVVIGMLGLLSFDGDMIFRTDGVHVKVRETDRFDVKPIPILAHRIPTTHDSLGG